MGSIESVNVWGASARFVGARFMEGFTYAPV